MARRAEVIFQQRVSKVSKFLGEPLRTVTYGVWIDLDDLERLVYKASCNKSRKATDGPLHVEIHRVD